MAKKTYKQIVAETNARAEAQYKEATETNKTVAEQALALAIPAGTYGETKMATETKSGGMVLVVLGVAEGYEFKAVRAVNEDGCARCDNCGGNPYSFLECRGPAHGSETLWAYCESCFNDMLSDGGLRLTGVFLPVLSK